MAIKKKAKTKKRTTKSPKKTKKKVVTTAALGTGERILMKRARGLGTPRLMKGFLNRIKAQEKAGLISPGERQRMINKRVSP